MNIASLFARIKLDADTGKAEKFHDQLKNIQVGLTVVTASVGAFLFGLKKITDEAMQSALALKQFHAETGLSTDELQKWQAVADRVSNSGQAVAQSIKAISANQAKIRLGQGNISGYQLLGIDPRQNPFQILEQLRAKTANMSASMKAHALEQIGVSKDLLSVLNLTKKQFDEMASEAFIIPKEAINNIDDMRASTKQLTNGLNYLKAMIASALAPNIIKLNKEIMLWIKQNKEGLIKTLKTVFKWITDVFEAVVNAIKVINQIISATIGWKNAMIVLIGIFAMLNAALIFSPLGIFIAGIILLVGVLDDLYVYSQGGDSLFGLLMDKFPEMEKKLKVFMDFMRDLSLLMKGLFEGDETGIDKFIEKWGVLGQLIVATFDDIKLLFQTISAIWTMIFSPLETFAKWVGTLIKMLSGDLTVSEGLGEINKAADENIKKQMDEWKKVGTDFTKMIKHGDKKTNPEEINKTGVSDSNKINNYYQTKNFNIKQDIQTKGDAKDTAKLVEEKLQKVFNTADTEFQYGGTK